MALSLPGSMCVLRYEGIYQRKWLRVPKHSDVENMPDNEKQESYMAQVDLELTM